MRFTSNTDAATLLRFARFAAGGGGHEAALVIGDSGNWYLFTPPQSDTGFWTCLEPGTLGLITRDQAAHDLEHGVWLQLLEPHALVDLAHHQLGTRADLPIEMVLDAEESTLDVHGWGMSHTHRVWEIQAPMAPLHITEIADDSQADYAGRPPVPAVIPSPIDWDPSLIPRQIEQRLWEAVEEEYGQSEDELKDECFCMWANLDREVKGYSREAAMRYPDGGDTAYLWARRALLPPGMILHSGCAGRTGLRLEGCPRDVVEDKVRKALPGALLAAARAPFESREPDPEPAEDPVEEKTPALTAADILGIRSAGGW